ncbi:MAG: hypothetical protein V2I43_18490 [Parvularcula sp.]|jgi:hypothetical protein|nr:hypothetical protein [Parvularcula sp.]
MSYWSKAALAAAVVFLSAAPASAFEGRTYNVRLAASWHLLTADQQHMVDLVAKDIWETERESHGVSFQDLAVPQKTNLREEALERLGMKPPRVSGVEV